MIFRCRPATITLAADGDITSVVHDADPGMSYLVGGGRVDLRCAGRPVVWPAPVVYADDDEVELMPQGVVDDRIDTVRPEHSPEATGRAPRVDSHGGEVYVYRRAGMACLVCGSKVRTELLAGRNLFWSGRCQRRG